MGVGRLISIKNRWCSGSMFIYQRVTSDKFSMFFLGHSMGFWPHPQAMSDAPVAVKPRVRAAAPAAAVDSRAAVAVTGAACRFPLEGTTPAEMWEQLVGKTETWRIMLRSWLYIYIYPIGSMYGIYANIGDILMVNVTIYSIHGSYGYINDGYITDSQWF